MRLSRRNSAFAAAVVVAASCSRPDATAPRVAGKRMTASRVVAFDTDSVMGSLSPIAQHVIAGLQDSSIRMAVYHAMTKRGASTVGLDLQGCADEPVVLALIREGEHNGAMPASQACGVLKGLPGAVLYMDPDRLRAWDGSTIPIVTALENPHARIPPTFHGYRATNRMIDLPADGSLKGPILVILPIVHPRRVTNAPPPKRRTVHRAISPDSLE
jgi:hypothetical protein